MHCNLVRLAALLAAAAIFGVNSLSFPASSVLGETIATDDQKDRGGCEHPNGCFPL